jgi:hypothetical protein
MAIVMWAPTAGGRAGAQGTASQASSQITLSFEREGMVVPRFALSVDRDGRGSYKGEQAVPGMPGLEGAPVATVAFDRTFAVSRATAKHIFALAQQANLFQVECQGHAKNVADMGKKTLRYDGPEGTGSCSFNYTDNKQVDQVAQILRAIAETMDEGRELDRLHRYDRLGLDDAMSSLARAAAAGEALELGNIAPSLRSIAADADVMQRVRMRASALLSQIPGDAAGR